MFSFTQLRSAESPRIAKKLLYKLQLFQRQPELINAGKYAITSDVDPEVVDLFFARVMGDTAEVVTAVNVEGIRALCEELGFSGFDDEIRAVLGSESKTRKDFLGLRTRVDRHDVIVEQLNRRVLELERQLLAQRGLPERVEAVERRIEEIHRNDVEGAITEARRVVGDIREDVGRLWNEVRERSSRAELLGLAEDVARMRSEVSASVRPETVRTLWEDVARLKEAEATRVVMTQQAKKKQSQSGRKGTTETVRQCQYTSNRLRGIIAHLTSECRGNVHKKGVVEVTASSVYASVYAAEHVVELGSSHYFGSKNEPNSWICYDFKGRRVAVTGYSLRTPGYCWLTFPGDCFPRSWVLEVSNDGQWWDPVDRRDDNFELRGKDVTVNFEISAGPVGNFRFVRLRQTDANHDGLDFLCLSSFEIFGTLYSQ